MEKSEILAEFSSDPDRYYRVALFGDEGFERAACARCGRFFWSTVPRSECPDHDRASAYSFIGDPPTPRRLDYAAAWSEVEAFFTSNGHASVRRYPVVCRWREDLHFTIASIVDFQRVMGSKVVFEFPANPLVVPQTCLRFKDLENVGVTGRHFSSFCMVGQHAVPDEPGGYWKDECVRLDHAMLTGPFGIARDEIVYVEDVWEGGGSFGPSLEYFVRGLELGNAVFTEFQGRVGEHERLDRRVIDMGAGLERLSWVTMGTPTAYDCCFGPVVGRAAEMLGGDAGSADARAYFAAVARAADEHGGDLRAARAAAARAAGLSEDGVRRSVAPLEAAYMVADHVRTLVFAIADGALPSNVGGGYNLRMMLRRIVDAGGRLGGRNGAENALDIGELVDLHVEYLSRTYPELAEAGGDVKRILGIEAGRYGQSRRRIEKIAAKMSGGEDGGRARQPSVSELVTLYESDGVTPDYLVEAGVISEVPPAFYSRLAELRGPGRRGAQGTGGGGGGKAPHGVPVASLPDTELLFYGEDPMEFDAQVLWAGGSSVVLDRTSFYARGGGQEPDRGEIGGLRVTDVARHGGVVVHTVEGNAGALADEDTRLRACGTAARLPDYEDIKGWGRGGAVRCSVDAERRAAITRNHTGTHILNASARSVLGSWVWQHSAFKDADHARLDVTHHSPLTPEEVGRIQDAANSIIRDDHAVSIRSLDRGAAEREYGFRIYQGGVVPVSKVRIVSIGGIDSEACGGTHVGRTGQVGALRITRAKRIQDGVVRLEFATGPGAGGGGGKGDMKDRDRAEEEAAAAEEAKAERDRARAAARQADKQRVPGMLEAAMAVPEGGESELDGIEVRVRAGRRACVAAGGGLGEAFHIEFGRRLVDADPGAAYCGVFGDGKTVRIVAYAGPESGRDSSEIVRAAAAAAGGSGGGNASFAQGGCKDASRRKEAVDAAREAVLA